jgi:putative N-acetyltransferase (TIGR04045 family)
MSQFICKVAETEAELQDYFAVRHAIFVEEQALFNGSDVDEYDEHAVHLVAIDRETGVVVGAVRCYPVDEETWFGGRLAVLKEFRRNGAAIGPGLCQLAEQVVIERGCRRFLAHIQLQNVGFFERLGWQTEGEPELYHGQPHQLMRASLAMAQSSEEAKAMYA